MGKFASLGGVFFIPYIVSYLMLWGHASRLRERVKPTGLPDAFSLFLGTAAVFYLWSDRHRQADNPKLSRLVVATRISQLLLPVGMILTRL